MSPLSHSVDANCNGHCPTSQTHSGELFRRTQYNSQLNSFRPLAHLIYLFLLGMQQCGGLLFEEIKAIRVGVAFQGA